MSIGIVPSNFPQTQKSIGLVDGSFGYYSGVKGKKQSLGKIGHWSDYGFPWKQGDLIKVDVDRNAGTIAFTHNNKFLGVAFKDKLIKQEDEFYFAVSLWGCGDSLELVS